jgi:asparagine synthase (glutamine-hydrolysing)
MCGICGYVGTHHPEWLGLMSGTMTHRGPDDAGEWVSETDRVGLAHRRLSIIDLSPGGHQPMCNEDGTVWITFNGEIYNHDELREELIQRGHVFRSRSDTEVLVHLYEERGPEMLGLLNGMFAFAVWDGARKQLFIARDHAGIKPLYYVSEPEHLVFASELKALLKLPGLKRELNTAAIPELLTFLWVPGDQTMLKGVLKLEPGHYLLWRAGQRVEIRRWFQLEYRADESVPEAEWVERVRAGVMAATRRQMMSDVPLGAFLSGGVDSSSLVACMRDAFPSRPITCYTARMDEGESSADGFSDDYPYARLVADRLAVTLKDFVLRPDITSLLPKMVWHLDEPDADPAVLPSYLIAKAAREDGTTVLLSGTGGDEVFFGYRSHQAYRQYAQMSRASRAIAGPVLGLAAAAGTALLGAQHRFPRRLSKFRQGLLKTGIARHVQMVSWSSLSARRELLEPQLFAWSDGDVEDNAAMRRYYDSFRGSGELNRHSHVLIQTFLAAHNLLYTDKSSMASSVEVRVPFLDLELMKLCATIPERLHLKGGVGKHLLRRAMAGLVPEEVFTRSKTGFMAPLRKWITTDLSALVNDLLGSHRLRSRGLFRPAAVARLIEENRNGRADHTYLIYSLLTLELWQQTFIDRAGEQVA